MGRMPGTIRAALLCILLLFSSTIASAGTAIRAARMVDVEQGVLVAAPVILIEDGRIVAAGSGLEIPDGWRVLDLGDVTLMPGLIDAHTHLLLDLDAEHTSEEDFASTLSERGEARRILKGAKHAREYLWAGFTTIRDVGNAGRFSGPVLADAIAAGWVAGPRMISCGRPLAPPGGQLGESLRDRVDREFREVRGAKDAVLAVDEVLAEGAQCIKIIVEAYRTLSQEEVTAATDAARAAGVRVTAHAMSPYATMMAVNAGVDSVDHAYFIGENVLRAMAARNIALIPTDLSLSAICELFHPGQACTEVPENFRRLVRSERARLFEAHALGVKIAAGSDIYYRWPGRTRGEAALSMFEAYAAAQLPPAAILRAATINAAEVLGIAHETGTLAAGKWADIIAVEGNPLDDISALRNVRFVMRGGQLLRNDSE